MQASPVSQWMAAWAVQYRNMTVAAACRALTKAKKTWGFGLCYLHLRNVRGFGWNHKRPSRRRFACLPGNGVSHLS